MRVLIVHNPRSGLRDGSIFTFIRHISQSVDELVLRVLDDETSIADLLSDATAFDMVVIAGGDGTISAACYELRNTKVPVLPFPAGTGNLLAANLDMPIEPLAIANIAKANLTLEFDLGAIEFDVDDKHFTRGFVVAAGAGYDADIMATAANLKPTFGTNAYILAAVARSNPTYSKFKLRLDNETIQCEGIAVMLLNFSKISPDLAITHDNNAYDGLFEVAVLKPHSTVELLPALFAALLDRSGGFPTRGPAIDTYLSSTIEISSDPPLMIQFDGETPGAATPIRARILPKAIRLVVPERLYSEYAAKARLQLTDGC